MRHKNRSAPGPTSGASLQNHTAEQEVVRRSRAKRHRTWDQIDRESGGIYALYLRDLARRFPTLSPMELRISALIKGMLRSWEISERLAIEEKTVENHRTNIRRKLGLEVSQNLQKHLL
ncbi:MAG: helix-turn-helix transcriptional regulator [Bacteroidota bacterium]|nr:helix-turn-helix transcriptional regulator [Bacteroidota bacterium]MDP4230091.1 helix-turn-helix transcriptional regulator [Bacteroidota bacterium]MDP4236164.1 helix-turn-helix transcriptional regulator [Bacteroidota bacterium]